jgi:chromosomal replication initiation ATPase DnaA
VSTVFCVQEEQLKHRERDKRNISEARQMFMKVAKLRGYKIREIANFINRTNQDVSIGIQLISRKMDVHADLRNKYREISNAGGWSSRGPSP